MMDFANEELTTKRWVHSVCNYKAFIKWCEETAKEEEVEACMTFCYVALHEIPDDDYNGNTYKEPLVIRRPDLGREWTLKQIPCDGFDCGRCRNQQGGWSFRWVGPWTCETLIGDSDTSPDSVVRRSLDCGCGRHGNP